MTNSLGNNTGTVRFNLLGSDGTTVVITTYVPSWRGIENPFGHIWKNCDGIKYLGNGTNQDVLRCDDPSLYSSATNSDGYTNIGTNSNADGYKTKLMFGDDGYGDINCKRVTGGSATSYYADYNYQMHVGGTYYACFVGGFATYGAIAGLAYVDSAHALSALSVYVGSRLCFTD